MKWIIDFFFLFSILLICNCFGSAGNEFAVFSKQSRLRWSPYTINEDCPIFVDSNVGRLGLGDELERLIYSLNIAKFFEATLLLDGGLILGSIEKRHSGSASYSKVADILGIRFLKNITSMNMQFGPLKEIVMSFPDLVELNKGLRNSSLRLHCRTLIRSDVGSCNGGWCPVVYPGHNFVNEVSWLLRNNSAKSYCLESKLGFPIKSLKQPNKLNVVWHIRTGDIALYNNKVLYYDTLLRTLLDSTEMKRKDIGQRLQLVFESQEKVPFLESEFPTARFNIGKDIFSSICTFLTSDIFISCGSTFALVLAFAQQPHHPIIFEEVRKETYLGSYSREHTVRQRHIFTKDVAVLLEEGKPIMRIEEVKRLVTTILNH